MTDSPEDFAIGRAEAAAIVTELGAKDLANGHWYMKVVARSLRAYDANANPAYFRRKYPRIDDGALADRLIALATRNAALVGAGSGATMTASELSAIVTGGAGLPLAIPAAVASVAIETVSTTVIQLRLVASLAALYGQPLDPDDPEDVLLAIKFFVGSKAFDGFNSAITKGGGFAAGQFAKNVASGPTLKLLQQLGKKVGVTILQRSVRNLTIPIVSIGIGGASNYFATRAIGALARKTMIARAEEFRTLNTPERPRRKRRPQTATAQAV